MQELPFDPAMRDRLSPAPIRCHHQVNYGGAVKRLNALRAQLATTRFGAAIDEHADAAIPGARWRDPGGIGTWATLLPSDRDVVACCVYGHEVGRATAMRLRAAGIHARFLRGGIDAWRVPGRPLPPKGGTSSSG